MKASDQPEGHSPTTFGHRGWTVSITSGWAAGHHARSPGGGHELWIHRVEHPVVVFGSTQRPTGLVPSEPGGPGAGEGDGTPAPVLVPVAGAGVIEVCRRRSGGGLVHVDPGDVWIDAVVPATSSLHHADIARAFDWFGRTWLAALTDAVTASHRLSLATVTPGRTAAARPFFCFADSGHGEVVFDGAKVVGLSQRRTRSWTRLQSSFVPRWRPAEIDRAVAAALGGRGPGPTDGLGAPPYNASEVRAGLPPAVTVVADVVEAVLHHVPEVGTGGATLTR